MTLNAHEASNASIPELSPERRSRAEQYREETLEAIRLEQERCAEARRKQQEQRVIGREAISR